MLDNLSISTDNFYKFCTTLSLLSTIYFFSFKHLFLEPYNQRATLDNIEIANLSAEYGYLKGQSLDLTTSFDSLLKNGNVQYFYLTKKDTSNIIYYYSTWLLKGNNKTMVDSLNLVNQRFGKVEFKLKALRDTQKVLEENIILEGYISSLLGGISIAIFFTSLFKWYKIRDEIDKKP